jgi:hypothetical protein
MTDHITLPRAEAERGRTALRLARKFVGPTLSDELSIFLAALDAALAGGSEMSAIVAACRQVAPEPDAKREPATYEQVYEAYAVDGMDNWLDYRVGWLAAERHHGITKEDK